MKTSMAFLFIASLLVNCSRSASVLKRFDNEANANTEHPINVRKCTPAESEQYVHRLAKQREVDRFLRTYHRGKALEEINIDVLRRETFKTSPETYKSLNMKMDVDSTTGVVTVTVDFKPARNGMGSMFGGTQYAIGDAVTEGMMLEMLQRHGIEKPLQNNYAAVTGDASIQMLSCTAPRVEKGTKCVVNKEGSDNGRVTLQYFYPSVEEELKLMKELHTKRSEANPAGGMPNLKIKGLIRRGVQNQRGQEISSVMEYNMYVFHPEVTEVRFDMDAAGAFDKQRDADYEEYRNCKQRPAEYNNNHSNHFQMNNYVNDNYYDYLDASEMSELYSSI